MSNISSVFRGLKGFALASVRPSRVLPDDRGSIYHIHFYILHTFLCILYIIFVFRPNGWTWTIYSFQNILWREKRCASDDHRSTMCSPFTGIYEGVFDGYVLYFYILLNYVPTLCDGPGWISLRGYAGQRVAIAGGISLHNVDTYTVCYIFFHYDSAYISVSTK